MALALTGCTRTSSPGTGDEKKMELPVATVGRSELKGKISHKGEPIVAGRLFFFAHDGMVPVAGVIGPDGNYSVAGLPAGELQVCVLLDPSGPLPFPTPPSMPFGPDLKGPEDVKGPDNMKGPEDMKGPPEGKRPPPMKLPPGMKGPPGVPGMPRLPPHLLHTLKNYTVPEDKQALYAELHKKYSQLLPEHPLKCVVAAGANTHDIVLP
jgi:hypothetical protein